MITLQIGQCGNQVGDSLSSSLHDHLFEGESRDIGQFFRSGIRRSILVDTEPKVIDGLLANASQNWRYETENVVCGKESGGAANNWAFGYFHHGTQLLPKILNLFRREAERCDRLKGINILHSAAGGTGSGLGSHVTEYISDIYPGVPTINCVIVPYTSGEVIVQNYNLLFTLRRISMHSGGVLVIENDQVNEICKKVLRLDRPTLVDLNGVIATNVTSALVPAKSDEGLTIDLSQKLRHLCSNKQYKFISSSLVPRMPQISVAFSADNWISLTKRLRQVHVVGATHDLCLNWNIHTEPVIENQYLRYSFNRAVSTLVTFHGKDAYSTLKSPYTTFERVRENQKDATEKSSAFKDFFNDDTCLYPKWSYRPSMFCSNSLELNGFEKSASLLSNSQAILRALEPTTCRAQEMYAAKAYVHQYQKYGLEREEFESTLMWAEQTCENYRSLSAG